MTIIATTSVFSFGTATKVSSNCVFDSSKAIPKIVLVKFGLHNSTPYTVNKIIAYRVAEAIVESSTIGIKHSLAALSKKNSLVWGKANDLFNTTKTGYIKSTPIHSNNYTLSYGYAKTLKDIDSVLWGKTNNTINSTTNLSYSGTIQLYEVSSVKSSVPGISVVPTNWNSGASPGNPENKIIVTKKNTYNTIINCCVVKLPERTEIEVLSASISTSIDSWSWSFKLTIANQASFELLRPNQTVKEFEITINYEKFIGIAEKYNISTIFGKKIWTITGRSKSAYLAETYAAIQNFTETRDKTNQQLVDVILQNSGWTVDWKTSVYLVPSNTYTVNIQYPINAIVDIARASGAVVSSDPNLNKLIIQPRYLNSPSTWNDNNSNVIVSSSYLTSINAEDFIHKSPVNKIYCIGKNNGVVVGVKIIGSAGNVVATHFTHELITHVDAGREKARNYFDEIKDNIEKISISSPFIGKVRCGNVLKIIEDGGDEWFSQVTDVKITISKNNIVTHDIELERHYL